MNIIKYYLILLVSFFAMCKFAVGSTPTEQASNLIITNLTDNSLTLSWTRGNGESVIIIGAIGGVSSGPTNGLVYSANSTFGYGQVISGLTSNYVIYQGASTTVDISGLTGSTSYQFYAFEFNGSEEGNTEYLISASGNNITSTTAPATQASNIIFSSISTTTMKLNWTNGDGSERIVLAHKGSTIDENPANGNTYDSDNDFSLGSQIGSGNYVVYKGSSNSVSISNLEANSTYYYKVFEYTGSGSSIVYQTKDATNNPNYSSTLKGEPDTQASDIIFSNISTSMLTLNFTAGDGDGRIVVAKASSAITGTPDDKNTYTADATFNNGQGILNSGEYIIYNGSGSSVTVSNLSSDTKYYFQVFEYNNSDTNINYLISEGNNNPNYQYTLDNEPGTQASSISFTNVTAEQMDISCTKGNGNGRLVIVSTSSITTMPSDGTTYTASSTFGSGSAIGSGYVAYIGTGNSFTLTGLSDRVTYYVRIFEYNNSPGVINYNSNTGSSNPSSQMTDYSSAPTVQASNITFTNVTTTGMRINWTKGNGDYRLVVIKEGDQGTITNPTDNVGYNMSTDWNSKADQLGTSGYYVVYSGTGNYIDLTNLALESNYWVQIFEFNNGSGHQTYNVTTNATNPASQTTIKEAPTTQATGLSFTNKTTSSLTVNWINGDGDYRIVVAYTSNSFTNDPSDGTDYKANSVYGSGDFITESGYVVYSGSSSSVNVTGLSASTTYYFKVFEYNNTGTNTVFCTSSGTYNPKSTTTLGAQVWTGAYSTQWNYATNWSQGSIPSNSQDVTVPSGVSNMPILSSTGVAHNITIQAGATLTIANGGSLAVSGNAVLKSPSSNGIPGTIIIPGTGTLTVSGTSSIERYVPTTSSHLFCSPISSPSISNFSGYYVGTYDEPSMTWNYLNSSSTMSAFTGYEIINSKGNSLLTFTGTFNNGDYSANLTNSIYPTSDPDEYYGWNLFGNPYPSSISWDASGWTKTNVDATVYVYDASSSTYLYYNTTSGGTMSKYIAPMQAFFVHVSGSSTGTLGVSNSVRSTESQTFKSIKAPVEKFDLLISNNSYSSEASIAYYNSATTAFDPAFDVIKLMGYNDSIPEIYTFLDDTKPVSINTFSTDTLTNMNIGGIYYKIGIKPGDATALTISIKDIDLIPDNTEVILVDNYEQNQVNLSEKDYEFSTLNLDNDRFQLVVKPKKIYVTTLSIDNLSDTIALNTAVQLSASILPENATNKTITWSIDNSSLATIDASSGLLSALSEGTATVTATANDGSGILTSQSIVFVKKSILVESLNIKHSLSSDTIGVNSTLQLFVDILPSNASNQTVNWSIDDASIASIDNNSGLLSAKAEGVIIVTATSNDGSLIIATKSITITTLVTLVNSISIFAYTDSIEINSQLQLHADILPTTATNGTVSWSVSDENIATINQTGLLTGKSVGTVTITATSNDASDVDATYQINVYNYTSLLEQIAQFKVYPNPANDFINIYTGIDYCNYTIYNSIGTIVKKGIFSNNATLSINGLSKGVYFIEIKTKTTVLKQQIVKE